MNPSPLSIGAIMILFGVFSVGYAIKLSGHPDLLCLSVAIALAGGGLGIILRKPLAFWLAMAAGAATFAVGAVGMSRRLPIGPGLPFPPLVTLVAGLWFCLRVGMARVSLTPRVRRSSETHDDDDDSDDETPAPPPTH